jgi:hydroxymethylpyrimidine pyrophosphatase-like HAD family hydrolase
MISPILRDDFAIIEMSKRTIEINSKNTNKGIALQYLLKHLNLTKDNLMAIGDSYNDVEMLKLAKYSFVMNHADNEIKKLAKFKDDISTSKGVGDVINKYKLETKQKNVGTEKSKK